MKLIIGGGSYKGLAFIGSLHYLYKAGKIDKIDEFCGISIGSYIGVLIIIGFTPEEIFNEILEIDFKEVIDFDVDELLNKFTLNGNRVFKKFNEIFEKKESKDITIAQFEQKYKTKINIVTTCINDRSTVIFDSDSPTVKVLDAVIASCSVPFIFPPYYINGKYYVDGDVRNAHAQLNKKIDETTILIFLKDLECSEECFENLSGYIGEIIYTIMGKNSLDKDKSKYSIELDLKYDMVADLKNITNETKTKLFCQGMKQAQSCCV